MRYLSKKIRYLTIVAVWGVCTTIVSAQNKTPAQLLNACGISLSPPKLVEFLERGFPQGSPWEKILTEPIPATQLTIFAIKELARKQSRLAVPVLIKTARGEFTPGERALVNYDCSALSPSRQKKEKSLLYEYIRFNAVNALGLIGDTRGLPVLQQVFEKAWNK